MIIQKSNLAKSGYTLDMKVAGKKNKNKNKNPSIFLATCLLELIIKIWGFGIYFFFEILANLSQIFSMKKSLRS